MCVSMYVVCTFLCMHMSSRIYFRPLYVTIELERLLNEAPGDFESPVQRATDSPSSSSEVPRNEELPELPQLKAPKRRAPKRYSSAARRHLVSSRRDAMNSPVTGPAESQ